MKQRDLISKINRKARLLGLAFDLVREAADHRLYRLDGQNVAIAPSS